MRTASDLYGKLLEQLMLVACGLLFLMILMICADVLQRNIPPLRLLPGLPWVDEVSQYMLYLVAMLAAPWLLRESRHIRVDILLRAMPARLGWYCEWATDIIALTCCAVMVVCGTAATCASYSAHALIIQALITPEWWSLAPLPIAFLLLGVEVLFRIERLSRGRHAPREDSLLSRS
jgi:TRAP-type C4-dicarboxylate transport system permease small subunit